MKVLETCLSDGKDTYLAKRDATNHDDIPKYDNCDEEGTSITLFWLTWQNSEAEVGRIII